MGLRSISSLADHPGRLRKDGYRLEVLAGRVEFERIRLHLVKALGCGDAV